ncbi:DUF5908 family protein [Aureibacter tunicatorum]|uniref:Uncharacterized protein n=1 Tax=Aureibacter tunicatorum TaxID=866807 RepID=A0AAE3XTD7_9BACT|nr:DUF5908 family protein [Aureibacter tunicatorum]MDR6241665.1 hypothetical protein [Aureibacter tunicatorum]BDD07349.1 hypothetical protein AUTU_48320 [Aureibacter tunicatorum]
MPVKIDEFVIQAKFESNATNASSNDSFGEMTEEQREEIIAEVLERLEIKLRKLNF